jgi:hypothetical protein
VSSFRHDTELQIRADIERWTGYINPPTFLVDNDHLLALYSYTRHLNPDIHPHSNRPYSSPSTYNVNMENDKGAKLVHFELADHVERVDATPESSAAPPQKTIYRDTKFIGTYIAICLGVLSSYGSYVMPATSLQLINADIGMSSG